MPDTVRAVVLSDIHATAQIDSATHVAEQTATAPEGNALTAAGVFVTEQLGSADLLLCPGDMVHRGDPAPMKWVWRELHRIAKGLGAVLVGSVGNHDLLQQPEGGEEAEQELRRLSPRFPYDDRDCVRSYWADSFGIVEAGAWRVISLNSCGLHGGFDQGEAKHGRLKPDCLPGIDEYLQEASNHPPVNICMCHHHPQEWSHGGERETRHLLQGDMLIDLLDSREERWMLLHGHKHYPALGYFGHSSHGPVRMAAGSVGISLLPDTGVEIRNQMHVIDFALRDSRQLGLAIAGEVASFTWDGRGAWAAASANAGLPSRVGFGYRRDGQDLARELAERAKLVGRGVFTWEAIVRDLDPRVRYLAPLDRDELLGSIVRLGGGVARDASRGFLEVTFP